MKKEVEEKPVKKTTVKAKAKKEDIIEQVEIEGMNEFEKVEELKL